MLSNHIVSELSAHSNRCVIFPLGGKMLLNRRKESGIKNEKRSLQIRANPKVTNKYAYDRHRTFYTGAVVCIKNCHSSVGDVLLDSFVHPDTGCEVISAF